MYKPNTCLLQAKKFVPTRFSLDKFHSTIITLRKSLTDKTKVKGKIQKDKQNKGERQSTKRQTKQRRKTKHKKTDKTKVKGKVQKDKTKQR